MKQKIALLLVLAVLVLSVWRLIAQSGVAAPEEGTTIPTHQTDPEETEAETVTDPTESVLQTEAGYDPTAPTGEDPAEDAFVWNRTVIYSISYFSLKYKRKSSTLFMKLMDSSFHSGNALSSFPLNLSIFNRKSAHSFWFNWTNIGYIL